MDHTTGTAAGKVLVRNQPTPDYRVTMDGKDLSLRLAPYVMSLSITETRGGESDTLDLTLDNSQGRLALPQRGQVVSASLGWVGKQLVPKGSYKIDEVEESGAPDIIVVRAKSASMSDGMHERRERSWHRQTISSIINTIAKQHSLTPRIGETLGKILIDHIDQTHESDLSFLTRLAKRYDAVMNVKDLRLLFMAIGKGVTASGKSLQELTITRADGDRHRYHASQRESYTSVRAHYHSNQKGKRKSVIIGGENLKNVKVLPESYATEAEARAAAQAEYDRTQRGQATLDYSLAQGMPEIFPELPIWIVDTKRPHIDETPWLVKQAKHDLQGNGLVTELQLEMRDDPTTDKHRSHFRRGARK